MKKIISLDTKRWENNHPYTSPGEHTFSGLKNKNISKTDAFTVFQAILLQSMLVTWDINIYATNTIEEIQKVKLSEWDVFSRRLRSIPLAQIAPGSQVEDIVRTLKRIGAKSTIFHRYAWSRRRKQRNPSQLNTFLSSQVRSI